MPKIIVRVLLGLLAGLVVMLSQTEVIQTVGALKRGKDVVDFYKAAVENPQEIVLLSLEIQSTFANSSNRFKDLSNDLAQKLGYFNVGPLGLDHVVLRSEPSPSLPYGFYSIALKKLKFKECEVLANYKAINDSFVRVELNGVPVSVNGVRQKAVELCKSQWFFQEGKNVIKYIGS